MKSLRLIISGRVQGVGYRDWLVAEARERGVGGWVRNRGAGQVEALLSGDDDAVDAVLAACDRGPPYARVASIAATECEPADEPIFRRLASV